MSKYSSVASFSVSFDDEIKRIQNLTDESIFNHFPNGISGEYYETNDNFLKPRSMGDIIERAYYDEYKRRKTFQYIWLKFLKQENIEAYQRIMNK